MSKETGFSIHIGDATAEQVAIEMGFIPSDPIIKGIIDDIDWNRFKSELFSKATDMIEQRIQKGVYNHREANPSEYDD